jgi:hypothetical protein
MAGREIVVRCRCGWHGPQDSLSVGRFDSSDRVCPECGSVFHLLVPSAAPAAPGYVSSIISHETVREMIADIVAVTSERDRLQRENESLKVIIADLTSEIEAGIREIAAMRTDLDGGWVPEPHLFMQGVPLNVDGGFPGVPGRPAPISIFECNPSHGGWVKKAFDDGQELTDERVMETPSPLLREGRTIVAELHYVAPGDPVNDDAAIAVRAMRRALGR